MHFPSFALFASLLLSTTPTPAAAADTDLESLRAAAESGDARSMEMLGRELWSADASSSARAEALRWLDRASALGIHDASRFLGAKYWAGSGVEEDDARAFAYTARCRDGTNGDCIAQLALLYEFGVGVESDVGKARELNERAIVLGSDKAKCQLGGLLQSYFPDHKRTVQLVDEAARAGVKACLAEAGIHAYMDGRVRDARDWYERAIASGDAAARNRLVVLLLYGNEEKDVERAVREVDGCFEHEVTSCATTVGAYFASAGAEHDEAHGKEFLLRAHERGDRFATTILADLAYFADPPNDGNARPFLEPVTANHKFAQLQLARVDARQGNAAAARERLLELNAADDFSAAWLLDRLCRSTSCEQPTRPQRAILTELASRLKSADADDAGSVTWEAWDAVDFLGADPRSDRRDGKFALRIAALLPLDSNDDPNLPGRNLETIAVAQARAGDFDAACATQQQAIALHQKPAQGTVVDGILAIAHARRDSYCAGKTWNQRVRHGDFFITDSFSIGRW